MLKVGLTGGIAAGKSTAAAMLARKGVLLFDADCLARRVVEPGQPAWEEIVKWLGNDYLHKDGTLNRKVIADLVFTDEASRQKLNSIVHPRVKELFQRKSSEQRKREPQKIQVWEIPLLFEAKMEHLVDIVVVVASSRDFQVERLMERDGLSRNEALRRIQAQYSLEEKIRRADYVLNNDETEEILQKQVDLLWEKLKKIR